MTLTISQTTHVFNMLMDKAQEFLSPPAKLTQIASILSPARRVCALMDRVLRRLIGGWPLVYLQKRPQIMSWQDVHMEEDKVTWFFNAINTGSLTKVCNGRGICNITLWAKERHMPGLMMKLYALSQETRGVVKTIHGALTRIAQNLQLMVMGMLLIKDVHALFTIILLLWMLYHLLIRDMVNTCSCTSTK